MTCTQKSECPAGAEHCGIRQNVCERLTGKRLGLSALTGWRGALASVNDRFRANGTYDQIATGRAARRKLARLVRSAGR